MPALPPRLERRVQPVLPERRPQPSRVERRQQQRRSLPSMPKLPALPFLSALPGRLIAVAVLLVAVVLVVIGGLRLTAAIPPAVVSSTMTDSVHIGGSAPALPWAPAGPSAIAVPSIGINVASAPEQAAPVASLTKIMTAYVILHDHPIGRHQSGPRLTMTQADLDDFNNDTVEDQANAQVAVGEVLTERQLLGGMLVHSANNFADTLARWDAGSVAAFVTKMNLVAVQLGMHNSHFADPSGFDPGSESTPSDLLRVAGPDMANPVFSSLVEMTSITLPVAGTIASYTPLLGYEGIIGVKSGYTSQAGGGDIVAVVRPVHGLPVLILGAVTGQQGPNVLSFAGLQALALSNDVGLAIGATPIVRSGQVVAHVSAAGHTVNAVVRGTANVLSWPGITAHRTLEITTRVRPGAKAGTRIGSLVVTAGTQRVVLPVMLSHSLPVESFSQRVF
jgi:D-alanyl-D-alanine carboxypeptidase (penicillin-binding protein 5/6)